MAGKRIGTVLKALREAKDMTQVELASKAKISQGYLARLEGGEKTNPSLDILQRLARALGVPLSDLLQ
jgi:transcriptional regulator with XRE-family HTH domain